MKDSPHIRETLPRFRYLSGIPQHLYWVIRKIFQNKP